MKIAILFILTGLTLLFAIPAYADCDRPGTMAGNVTLTADCTYTYTYDGVDNPGNNEASTANSGTITLGNFNLTVSAGQSIVAGSFIINGTGGIALSSGGSILPGGGLWIYDNDADGWLTDFTNNSYRRTSTAAGYRRLGLMVGTTADCDDANNSLTNNCYSYSYGYSQGSYYSYSYSYGQASYYGYGQSQYGAS